MTLYEFNQVPTDAQAQYIWEQGVFIECVRYPDVSFSLYSIFNFWAEFELKDNVILTIRTFKRGDHLEKYIKDIDIESLIQ